MVFVDFWASWCGPCRMFGPVFEDASKENPDIVFAKVDTEAEAELAATIGVMSIPTLMVFLNKCSSIPRALPHRRLEHLIGQVRALDMDEVHRQAVESQAADAAS